MAKKTRRRFVADSQQYIEKREHERYHVSATGEVSFGGESVECSTIDISAGGAKVRFKTDPFKNVVLSIPPFGEMEGEIVWKDEEYVGIKFHGNHDRMAEIVNTIVTGSRR
jgi:hypothetical protein